MGANSFLRGLNSFLLEKTQSEVFPFTINPYSEGEWGEGGGGGGGEGGCVQKSYQVVTKVKARTALVGRLSLS